MSANYLEFNQFLKEKGEEKKPLRLIQTKQLKALDQRCEQCMLLDNTMLCPGVRLYFDKEESEASGTCRLYQKECPKLMALKEHNKIQNALLATFLDRKTLNRYMNEPTTLSESEIALQENQITVGDVVLPTVSWHRIKQDMTTVAHQLVIAGVMNGYRTIYMHPPSFYHHYTDSLEKVVPMFVDECDWLIVDGFDLSVGMDLKRQLIFQVVQQRAARNLPTTISISEKPQAHAESEKEFYSEVEKKWKKFPLDLLLKS